jgi:hypothetical protein
LLVSTTQPFFRKEALPSLFFLEKKHYPAFFFLEKKHYPAAYSLYSSSFSLKRAEEKHIMNYWHVMFQKSITLKKNWNPLTNDN